MNPLRTATDFVGGLVHTGRVRLAELIDPEVELEIGHPDPILTARLALAMATAASQNNGNPHAIMTLVHPMIVSMHPFHMVEVSLSLATMVAAVADEDDLASFGQSIMEAEVGA